MSSKQQAMPDAGASSPWRGGVLEMSGRDAGAFAQAQLMNDVRALADGQWQWTGWLTPKGRVQALGALLRLDAERYWWLLPDAAPGPLAEALQRFVFRSKVRLEPRAELTMHGYACAPAALGSTAQGARAQGAGARQVLDLSGERPRTLLLDAAEPPSREDALDAAGWALEDLGHGLPRLDPAAEPAHTPQMLDLARLGAYSVKKGCYPGQEIVARTHFLGQAKRSLQRLRAARPLAAGSMLRSDAGEQPVLCAAATRERWEALAVLPLEAGDIAWHADPETPVAVIPFADGLAR